VTDTNERDLDTGRGPSLADRLLTPVPGRRDVRELLRLVNRRKWQLVGITALICTIAGVILAQLTPEYRATALVLLDTRKIKVTNATDLISAPLIDTAAVQTEIEVLRSAALLGRVVDKLQLAKDSEYGAVRESALSQAIRQVKAAYYAAVGTTPSEIDGSLNEDRARLRAIVRLQGEVSIVTRSRSFVIAVWVDSVDRVKAKRIVDAITDFYIVDQLQAKLDANKRAVEFFNDRLEELKHNVQSAERGAAEFRERSGLTIGKDATIASQSLTELNSQLVQARAQRADKESRLVALQEAQRNPQLLGGITEVVSNGLITSLRAQEAEVARRIGDLNQRYGESHPRLLQARAEQGQIQARINSEVAKIIVSVQGDAEAARSKENQLEQQVGQMEKAAGGLGQSEVQLRQLEREAQSSRAVYEDFLKRFKEIREQQDLQQPDARVLSAATVPAGAVYPRYGLTMVLAFAAGLILSGFIIVLIERLDGGFRNGDQIERLTGHALVGMVPGLSRLTLGKLLPARFAVAKPTSAYAEALRSTHTAIMLGALDRPPKIIMVTSSLPGEGKSTFVCSMAALMARSNPTKKILVVDCDLRRSSVVKVMGTPETGGTIDEYLSGAKTLDQILGRDEESGVYYIPARANTPNSAEILDSRAMRTFVEGLAAQFDLVFLDTPPLMAVSDARISAKIADYIVFLVRWEQTSRELAVNSLKLVRDSRKPVGIVLAQVNIRRHSRYGYGDYGYYYSKYRDYYTS
jgi:capsular exopolysaccharide synthesis family protein